MTPASAALLAVAKELAAHAKSSMPELQEGEYIKREMFQDGIYTRVTELNGDVILCQYDFRQKSFRRIAGEENVLWGRLK